MEYWVFQPKEDITAYEVAVLLMKLRKIPKTQLHGVSDAVYDRLANLQRHFLLYSSQGIYKSYEG